MTVNRPGSDEAAAHFRSLVSIHVAVLLFGLAGPVGALVQLAPSCIVFGRAAFAAFALLVAAVVTRTRLDMLTPRNWLKFLPSGALLAMHWVAFFQSIQLSTVSIGLVTASTFPIWTTFIESWQLAERLRLKDMMICLLVLCGVLLMNPSFSLQNEHTQGVLWGLAAAVLFAFLSMMNKAHVRQSSSIQIAFYQNTLAAVALLPAIVAMRPAPAAADVGWLLMLGVICTSLPHTLFIAALKHVRARTASVLVCLEPVYGTIVAALWIAQVPSTMTIIGGSLILGAACYASLSEPAAKVIAEASVE